MSNVPQWDAEILVCKAKGQPIGYSFSMLDAEVAREEGEDDDGFKSRLATLLGGEWKGIRVKKPWQGEDVVAVETALRRYDERLRLWVRDDLKYQSVFIEHAVAEWEFDQPKAANGFLAMGDMLGAVVFKEVYDACYPNPLDDPNWRSLLSNALTTRSNGSAQETPKAASSIPPSRSGGTG